MEQTSNQFQVGDLVVGSRDPSKSVYSPTGARNAADGVRIFGHQEDISAYEAQLLQSIKRSGGQPIAQDKTTKTAKKSNKPSTKTRKFKPAAELAYENRPQSFYSSDEELTQTRVRTAEYLQTVIFENDFGKIKAKVEKVVEHSQAYMLVFSDDDAVVFEPKVGETLLFYPVPDYSTRVYYPGVTFDWFNDNRKLMILFKVPAENEE